MSPVLSTTGLGFKYGEIKALDDVSISLSAGQFCALLGRNGAGKSTLFSLITGLYRAHAGSITINGNDLVGATRNALASIGVVFQQSTLDLDLTVLQNLHYAGALQGMNKAAIREQLRNLLEPLGVAEFSKRKTAELSGGQRRKVELARALLHKPEVLLLDEPTVGLDMESRREFVRQVKALCESEGVGVLWATHLMEEVGPDDQLNILHEGKLIAAGQTDSLLAIYKADSVEILFEGLVGESVTTVAQSQ